MTNRLRPHRILGGLLALGLAAGMTATTGTAASAQGKLGSRSLATVLAQDGNHFDDRWNDFDIVDRAVRTVLTAKPGSPVGVLAQGNTRLTAFVPTDRAFRALVNDLAGRQHRTEAQVFAAVAGLGVDTVENVLLYHVVPGTRVLYHQALRADGARLGTALPGADPITVDVRHFLGWRYVSLVDADPNDQNPAIAFRNINVGNKQIAHGINRVLRPADL